MRRGATWYAVKISRSGSDRYRGDLRYEAGLTYALRRARGRWRELVPQRPRTELAVRAGAGPVLVNGGPGHFFGHAIDVGESGVVSVSGEYRNPVGSLRSVSFSYRPVRCGVVMEWDALAGEAYRLAVFFSRRPRLLPLRRDRRAPERHRRRRPGDVRASRRARSPRASEHGCGRST